MDDLLDRFLAALDDYRRERVEPLRGESFKRTPVPSTFAVEKAKRADRARGELREVLRAVVVEIVREDYRAGGVLREMLREDLAAGGAAKRGKA